MVAATFATVIEITVAGNANITADIDRTASGWDRHNVALLLLAGFALVMLVGSLRGGRPAMFALATCGLAVLLIAVIGDAPDLDKTGPIGELYEDARAEAGSGFYFETLGGALLLIAGVGLLVLGAGGGAGATRATTRARETRDVQDEPTAAQTRARERTAGSAPASGEGPAETAREEAPAETAAPAPPADQAAATDAPRLTFDERLRQARERARRKP